MGLEKSIGEFRKLRRPVEDRGRRPEAVKAYEWFLQQRLLPFLWDAALQAGWGLEESIGGIS